MYVVLGLGGCVCCLCLTKEVRSIQLKKHNKAVAKHAGRIISMCRFLLQEQEVLFKGTNVKKKEDFN